MGKRCLIIFISILFSSLTFGQNNKVYENGYIVRVGDKVPDFVINEAGGGSYRLSDMKGKVIFDELGKK